MNHSVVYTGHFASSIYRKDDVIATSCATGE